LRLPVDTRLNLQSKIDEWRNQDPAVILAGVNQHLPFWVSLGLVIVIAWYLARIVWLLVPEPPIASVTPVRAAPANNKPVESNYTAIADSHIFGEANPDDVQPVAQSTENAPETKLNLELRGAIMSDDPKQAHAIISAKGKSSEVYFVGDAIPGGATLHEVQSAQVILNRGGVLETLKLPKLSKGTGATPAASTATTTRRNFGPRTVRDSFGDGGDGTVSFTDIVRPQPYMPDGKLKGYRIYPGRDRKRFAALGLRPGDLVVDINGIALNNMAEGMNLFQTLGNATQVTVTLERSGQTQTLTLDTSQLMNKDGGR